MAKPRKVRCAVVDVETCTGDTRFIVEHDSKRYTVRVVGSGGPPGPPGYRKGVLIKSVGIVVVRACRSKPVRAGRWRKP